MPKPTKKPTTTPSPTQIPSHFQPAPTTLSALRTDPDLMYRLHVLLYDLSNVSKDAVSAKRICMTTHELYISGPYFTAEEAGRICAATVVVEGGAWGWDDGDGDGDGDDGGYDAWDVKSRGVGMDVSMGEKGACVSVSVEEAVHRRLCRFLEKRKASGDARPCGPHDLLPVYLDVFGVGKEKLRDPGFLSRMRRNGVALSL